MPENPTAEEIPPAVLTARSPKPAVREWLAKLSETARGGSAQSIADFLSETLSASSPPDFRSGDSAEEVASAASDVLKGLLARAETNPEGHQVAIKALVNAGVLKKTEMSAVEAISFVRELRNRGGAGKRKLRDEDRTNPCVVCMICAGMPIGRFDADTVANDPAAACELIASCKAAAEESSARASALEMFVGCASAGVRLDADTLLCPDHTGEELLQQAKEIVSQATGLPICIFFGA